MGRRLLPRGEAEPRRLLEALHASARHIRLTLAPLALTTWAHLLALGRRSIGSEGHQILLTHMQSSRVDGPTSTAAKWHSRGRVRCVAAPNDTALGLAACRRAAEFNCHTYARLVESARRRPSMGKHTSIHSYVSRHRPQHPPDFTRPERRLKTFLSRAEHTSPHSMTATVAKELSTIQERTACDHRSERSRWNDVQMLFLALGIFCF